MAVLNDTPTADRYPDQIGTGASVATPGAGHVNVIVTVSGVYMQMASRPAGGGGAQWLEEEFLPIGGFGFAIGAGEAHAVCDAVQFRSAAAGIPGRVTVKA
jgi:hypothetical protein